jgi:hypothetical protein
MKPSYARPLADAVDRHFVEGRQLPPGFLLTRCEWHWSSHVAHLTQAKRDHALLSTMFYHETFTRPGASRSQSFWMALPGVELKIRGNNKK